MELLEFYFWQLGQGFPLHKTMQRLLKICCFAQKERRRAAAYQREIGRCHEFIKRVRNLFQEVGNQWQAKAHSNRPILHMGDWHRSRQMVSRGVEFSV